MRCRKRFNEDGSIESGERLNRAGRQRSSTAARPQRRQPESQCCRRVPMPAFRPSSQSCVMALYGRQTEVVLTTPYLYPAASRMRHPWSTGVALVNREPCDCAERGAILSPGPFRQSVLLPRTCSQQFEGGQYCNRVGLRTTSITGDGAFHSLSSLNLDPPVSRLDFEITRALPMYMRKKKVHPRRCAALQQSYLEPFGHADCRGLATRSRQERVARTPRARWPLL